MAQSMKLLFLYGPTAVGKFTVAKELAVLTGYKFLHNHLTIDLVTAVFEPGSAPYFQLLRQIRLSLLEAAAQAHIPGLIMTFVYGSARLESVGRYSDMMTRLGGEICFVRLYCEPSILSERVVSEDRKVYGKLVNVEKLHAKLEALGDPFAEIKGADSLSIDVGIHRPTEAAEEIAKHYGLPGAAV